MRKRRLRAKPSTGTPQQSALQYAAARPFSEKQIELLQNFAAQAEMVFEAILEKAMHLCGESPGVKKPTSPPKALGRAGFVQIENFRYHRQAVLEKSGTRRYLVQFDRTVWRGSDKVSAQTWSATVDFQYHPELPMSPRDRDDNLIGLQVLAYSASSDTAEPTPPEVTK